MELSLTGGQAQNPSIRERLFLAESTLRAFYAWSGPVRRGSSLAILPCLLIMAIGIGTAFGDVSIAPSETLHILLHKLGLHGGPVTWSRSDEAIIWQLRLPRVLAAALVGASLGVAGALLQAILRNPLADPYVIGTSAGAQLGVALSWLLPFQISILGFSTLQAMAFVGALVTILFVYSLARSGGRTPVVALLLSGFVVSSFLISFTSLLMQFSGRLNQIISWTMGSLGVSEFAQVSVAAPIIGASLLGACLLSSRLDILSLGEDEAHHLGVGVERLKLVAIILASLLTALAVTLSGVIAFVGLVVPHVVRLLYGPGHRVLLPASGMGGALFVIVADLIARIATPLTPLPLGVVTAVIGAPFFLHLLRRGRRDYAF
jgi:iron complex transport system permease protein